ncbi:hypothetical protein BDQ17DRAFT_1375647, partial [Cyathus striatus]
MFSISRSNSHTVLPYFCSTHHLHQSLACCTSIYYWSHKISTCWAHTPLKLVFVLLEWGIWVEMWGWMLWDWMLWGWMLWGALVVIEWCCWM